LILGNEKGNPKASPQPSPKEREVGEVLGTHLSLLPLLWRGLG